MQLRFLKSPDPALRDHPIIGLLDSATTSFGLALALRFCVSALGVLKTGNSSADSQVLLVTCYLLLATNFQRARHALPLREARPPEAVWLAERRQPRTAAPLAAALALLLILCWNYGVVKIVENNFTFRRASTRNFNLLRTTEFF